MTKLKQSPNEPQVPDMGEDKPKEKLKQSPNEPQVPEEFEDLSLPEVKAVRNIPTGKPEMAEDKPKEKPEKEQFLAGYPGIKPEEFEHTPHLVRARLSGMNPDGVRRLQKAIMDIENLTTLSVLASPEHSTSVIDMHYKVMTALTGDLDDIKNMIETIAKNPPAKPETEEYDPTFDQFATAAMTILGNAFQSMTFDTASPSASVGASAMAGGQQAMMAKQARVDGINIETMKNYAVQYQAWGDNLQKMTAKYIDGLTDMRKKALDMAVRMYENNVKGFKDFVELNHKKLEALLKTEESIMREAVKAGQFNASQLQRAEETNANTLNKAEEYKTKMAMLELEQTRKVVNQINKDVTGRMQELSPTEFINITKNTGLTSDRLKTLLLPTDTVTQTTRENLKNLGTITDSYREMLRVASNAMPEGWFRTDKTEVRHAFFDLLSQVADAGLIPTQDWVLKTATEFNDKATFFGKTDLSRPSIRVAYDQGTGRISWQIPMTEEHKQLSKLSLDELVQRFPVAQEIADRYGFTTSSQVLDNIFSTRYQAENFKMPVQRDVSRTAFSLAVSDVFKGE